MIGHAHTSDDPDDIAALVAPGYDAELDRAFVIDIIGFDWNCPQHIPALFNEQQITQITRPLLDEITQLRAQLSQREGM
ncbi:hypothetical protein V474_02535 [Novosphingobium barchaimii LL02]|uniref:Uncharacterized protein n=1 Tax=Novosphingobium barchaimii LL02 TaxID=1114963 RepID=A0A0J7XJQ6_9SPHN|nr:hypothetical protein [Novosphingobium barchaimii]KMS51942.1 hypothetical protein V474_02535 [Novosphingobium barchaimii LL02]